MLPRDEVLGLNWGLLGRNSSDSQSDNTSTTIQLRELKQEVDETNGNIVKTFDITESAASMDRDSLNEFLDLAKEDKLDIIGVWKLDRLTRASPWETLLYLNELREEGVILYAHTHGYFEWDNLYDFEMLSRRLVFAREWYQRIIEGGREGQVELLDQGKWPFGPTPHGYTMNDDQDIRLTERGREINQDIIQLYLEDENMEDVHEEINNRYEKNVGKSQIGNILQNRILVGDLTLNGEVISHKQDLKVIDEETFDRIQKIRKKNSSTPSKTRDYPQALDRGAFRFGVEFVLDLLQTIGRQCRKCGSDTKPNGTTERWGTTLRKYACKDQECGYEGPLLKQSEFEDLHQMLPLRCPYCPFTDRYEVEQRSDGLWEYKYTCESCGESFGSDMSPNKVKRSLNNPRLTFKWGQKADPSQVEKNGGEDTDGSKGMEETDQSQITLANY